MNLVLQLLIATVLIALFTGLRIFTNRRAALHRRNGDSGKDDCDDADCFQGCGKHSIPNTSPRPGGPDDRIE